MDVAVIGGGIVGTAVAYHLTRQGVATTLWDGGNEGWATGAGAGIISGETTGHPDRKYFEVARQAGSYYRILVDELGGPEAAGYSPSPLLEVAMADDDVQAFDQRVHRIIERNQDNPEGVEGLSEERARELCPQLGPLKRALVHWNAARVDGRRLTERMREVAQLHGLVLRHETVQALKIGPHGLEGVKTHQEDIAFDRVVVAAGVWTPQLLAPHGITVPIEPQRGQIVHLHSQPASLTPWPIFVGMRGHYLLPWPDGRVIAGATREVGSGAIVKLTAGGQHEVLKEAMRIIPQLSESQIVEWRIGLRPMSPDQKPLMGAIPDIPGLFVATGHGAGGLLMGPYTAKLLAESLVKKDLVSDLDAFDPMRFGK